MNDTSTDVAADNYTYICYENAETTCADTCVSLAACDDCHCAIQESELGSGPWGEVMDVLLCLLPVIVLIIVTIKPHPWPTTTSLPVAAVLMFLVRTAYLGSDPLLTAGAVVSGFLEAWTPLSIMAGAIFLFESMEMTLCLPYMMRELQYLTKGHRLAQLLLVFGFCYMVEGASGFGTPVALAAPMLVRTGQPAMESVVCLLVFTTFSTVWGAVGTPLWFGLGTTVTDDDELIAISQKAAIALAVSAFTTMPVLLTTLVPWTVVQQNLLFVYASLIVTIGPSVGIAMVNYEFPSLAGGLIGMVATAVLIQYKVGMRPDDLELKHGGTTDGDEEHNNHNQMTAAADLKGSEPFDEQQGDASPSVRVVQVLGDGNIHATNNSNHSSSSSNNNNQEVTIMTSTSKQLLNNEKEEYNNVAADSKFELAADVDDNHSDPGLLGRSVLARRKTWSEGYVKECVLRTFPLWGVVLILIITRVEQIGVKEHLTDPTPYGEVDLGTLGTFRVSATLVFSLINILTYPDLNWSYALLYVPFLIPFVLVSLLTMLLFRKDLQCRPADIVATVISRLVSPAIAIFGALVLVQLMIKEGNAAPATILGTHLADWFQEGFVVISPLVGALGSFFSGSTTVSNLTFGGVQEIAAASIGTSRTTMLALQSVGGSAGNGICLNNIIAGCAVVGLTVGEGTILLRTYKYVLATTTISTAVMLAFFFRF